MPYFEVTVTEFHEIETKKGTKTQKVRKTYLVEDAIIDGAKPKVDALYTGSLEYEVTGVKNSRIGEIVE